ncbi:MAG: ABC transporter permease [Lachnospiraceae bacterium]|nr:ABC transporter permease [Lachnospiraceae bacterium]
MENAQKKVNVFNKIIQIGIISWGLVILIWALGAYKLDKIFLPSPLETGDALLKLAKEGTLWSDIAASFGRVAKGWGLAIATAVPIGLIVGHFKHIRWLVEPVLNLFRFVPAIALTSLFLMWFGVDDKSKVALILYASFFPILVNTIAGVVSTDKSLIEAASCMGAGRVRVFFTVILPSAVPNIFTGVRLGLSSSIICVIAAEMLVGGDGLGYRIQSSRMYYKTDWAFAGIVTLAILGFVADRLLLFLGAKFLKHFGVKKA